MVAAQEKRREQGGQLSKASPSGSIRVVPESFERSVALIRRLTAAGFTVVEEFDVSGEPYFLLVIARRSCVLLLYKPMLLLEPIALHRSVAVFLPLHVVINGDRDISSTHWANPVTCSGLQLPVRDVLDEVYRRITEAISRCCRHLELNRAKHLEGESGISRYGGRNVQQLGR
jgi:hypothetical protein